MPLRTSKWWQPDQNGGCVMTVKVGSKRIEFEKGKAAISVVSLDRLPAIIDSLIKAVRGGDPRLDFAQRTRRTVA
jgi:hypothetical protein